MPVSPVGVVDVDVDEEVDEEVDEDVVGVVEVVVSVSPGREASVGVQPWVKAQPRRG